METTQTALILEYRNYTNYLILDVPTNCKKVFFHIFPTVNVFFIFDKQVHKVLSPA